MRFVKCELKKPVLLQTTFYFIVICTSSHTVQYFDFELHPWCKQTQWPSNMSWALSNYFYFKIQMATAEKGLTIWLHIQHATHCLTLLSSLHSRATWAEAIVYFSGSFHQERCTQLTRRDFFKASRTELNKIVIIKQKKINIAWSGGLDSHHVIFFVFVCTCLLILFLSY